MRHCVDGCAALLTLLSWTRGSLQNFKTERWIGAFCLFNLAQPSTVYYESYAVDFSRVWHVWWQDNQRLDPSLTGDFINAGLSDGKLPTEYNYQGLLTA